MKRLEVLLFPVVMSCLASACTNDYDQFNSNGIPGSGGVGATAGSGGTGASAGAGGTGATGGTGGTNTGGTGDGGTGGTGTGGTGTGGTGTGGTGNTGGTGGTGNTGGTAGMGGTGGVDAGLDAADDVMTDAPDDTAVDAPDDVAPDGGVVCSEPGGQVWSQNGHCYFPQNQSRAWASQRDECVAAGAHLVAITSQEENSFVKTLVGNQDYWIGLHRPQAGDPFDWVTSEAVSFTDWAGGEPNETGESCVRVRNSTPSWYDRGCTPQNQYRAICERP